MPLGYDDIGYHNPKRKTPYMNWLAENGLRMEQSYVTPMCSPSRAALLTGKYPHKIGHQVTFRPLYPVGIQILPLSF